MIRAADSQPPPPDAADCRVFTVRSRRDYRFHASRPIQAAAASFDLPPAEAVSIPSDLATVMFSPIQPAAAVRLRRLPLRH